MSVHPNPDGRRRRWFASPTFDSGRGSGYGSTGHASEGGTMGSKDKALNANAVGMCVNRGQRIGTLPGTSGIYFAVDGKVWLVVDGKATNCGDYFAFRERAEAGKVRFAPNDATAWTDATVRENLPAVRVYNADTRKEAAGTVAGRRNEFATVYVGEARYEFAWSQIAGALNAGRPLIV